LQRYPSLGVGKDAVSFEPFGIEVDFVADPHSAVSKKKHEAPNTPTILPPLTGLEHAPTGGMVCKGSTSWDV
jgi:hypothetical protein